MERPRAWVMNLDAEDELSLPAGATLSYADRQRVAALRPALASLLLEGDIVVPEETPTTLPPGAYQGRAWCPTPRALRALRAAGASVPEAPSREVLRAANHRRLCASLGQTLPGARWATTRDEVLAITAEHGATGSWLIKRALGYAGRGRFRVAAGVLNDRALRWLDASMRDGVQVEPWVERAGDYALHGWIAREGTLALGEATTQCIDAQGAWQSTRRTAPDELSVNEHAALVRASTEVVDALRALGYWGPFGVDAFRWRDADGALQWNPRCEVNARYSMGWAIGMGDRRPDR